MQKLLKLLNGGGGGGALDEGLFSPSVSHEQGHIKTIFFGGGGVNLTLQRTTKNSLSRTGFELESSGF